MTDFVDRHGVNDFAHIPDDDGALWDRYGIRRQSSYVFVNDDGTHEQTGYGDLNGKIEELLLNR